MCSIDKYILSLSDEDLNELIYNILFIRYNIISKESKLYEFHIYEYDVYTGFSRISFKVIYDKKKNSIVEVNDCRIFDANDELFYTLFKDKQELIRLLNSTIDSQKEDIPNLIKNII